MAAIISQIAANKRARAKNHRSSVSSDKCVYSIPPFDPCFNPVVHNKYCRSMALLKKQEMDKEKRKGVFKNQSVAEDDEMTTRSTPFAHKIC